ncbi:hypothetical protein [Tsuneonella mangrovi]|uniref:hypothetical protein n=1 Tax=Tsuneonella mangrovi TaxID=1982042 RepID=UPI0012379BC6|nr:hypothetical protein [Tsuneonella mangrovi]
MQTAIPASSPAQVALAGKLRRDQVEIVSGGLPPPSGTAGGISDGGSIADPIAAFADYADKAGTVPPIGYERHSAMLANPAALDGKTAVCSVHPAAVLVDLDPKGSTFAVPEHPAAAPGLATALARLRNDGITVGWASGATADKAGAISRALVASGLDPDGKDTLVLLRYPDDRKETRRQDFAKQYCVVAIAGQDRTDFDELYAYLKDPSAALPLEKLVGKGWFLIPQPLS